MFLLRGKLEVFKTWGYIGVFLLNLLGNATIIVPAAPGIIGALAAGSVLNPILVSVFSALGATIGETTGYLAGFGGKGFVEDNKWVAKIDKWMKKYGLWTIFALAAIPNPLFDVAGIISGATGIPLYKYLIVVFAGKLIKFGIISLLGYAIL